MKYRQTISIILSMLSVSATVVSVAQADVSTTIQISVNLSANNTTHGSLNPLQLDLDRLTVERLAADRFAVKKCREKATNQMEDSCLRAATSSALIPDSRFGLDSRFDYESLLAANGRSIILITPI